MSKTTWIIFIVLSVAILGGLIGLSRLSNPRVNVDDINHARVLPASEASGNIADRVAGNPDSKVVLVEYADFQCPGCASAYGRIKAITEDYQDHVAVVLRNFPITTAHPHAMASAASAEAAGKQGKYWEMAELLFENQQAWTSATAGDRTELFLDYARQLGLDEAKFKADQASPEVSRKITFDQALGSKAGVSSTPSFFLNGTKLNQDIWGDDQAFRKALDDAIRETGGTPPQAGEQSTSGE